MEINPLCLIAGKDGKDSLMAVDAKMGLDDNALYRHPNIQAMRDLAEEAPLETEAGKFNLNYIKLDGSIACLVNGAGLAMATMDIIQHFGGQPANFLDVGGGASKEQVTAAFRIILSDPNVKGILVNIFGGIMQCDIIAAGIVAAVKETRLNLPLVVRLEGNNVAIRQTDSARFGPAHHQRRFHGRRRAKSRPNRGRSQTRHHLISMAILVNSETKLLVQGITGSFGARHTQLSIDYGTQVVAGVTPGKGGQSFEHAGKKVPIFDTVAEAARQTGATASAIFVPPPFAADAILEAADAGLELVVCITEGIPVLDMLKVKTALGEQDPLDRPQLPGRRHARAKDRTRAAAAASASLQDISTSRATLAWFHAAAR